MIVSTLIGCGYLYEIERESREQEATPYEGYRGAYVVSDEELFQAIKQGDGEALSELYDRYAALVNRAAKRLIKDEQIVQEVVQDVFTRVWTTTAEYPAYGRLEHWLYVVTRRIAIDHLRKRRRGSEVAFVNVEINTTAKFLDESIEQIVDQKLLREELLHTISGLHLDQQVILHHAYFQGYTLSEIAAMLQIPVGTVKTKLHQSLKYLRMAFEAQKIEE